MSFEQTCSYLGNAKLGILGAGHLGRAIAGGLLAAGFANDKLAICRPRSTETYQRLAEADLTECVTDTDAFLRQTKIILYAVRPQDYQTLGKFTLRADYLLVSFLAGIPLARLPDCQRVRVMPSAPDTLQQQNGIAALYPADNVVVRELLTVLKLRLFPLQHESQMHAFTALGTCLPIALTYWESLGRGVEDTELSELAAKFALPNYAAVLAWADSVKPHGLSAEERTNYVRQAATPGGVTEAILQGINAGQRLSCALGCGIARSIELSAG